MLNHKKRVSLPRGFLWRLTFLNIFIIGLAISLSGWAVYNTACFLVEGMGSLPAQRQQQFNATLYQYLLVFTILGVLFSSVLHYYFTKRLVGPIKQLIEATEILKKGAYPPEIQVTSNDEIGELVSHYNELTKQLKDNDSQRERLITNLSHEIRTPVANLQGYLHALKTGTIEGDRDLYESLYNEANRLTLLIEQIDQINHLDTIQLNDKQLDKLWINEIIEETLKMFEWEFEKSNIALSVSLQPSELIIHEESIKQLVSNLIDNAIKYNDGNKPIKVTGNVANDVYKLIIGGTSGPLTAEEQEKLFNRFYRTDPSRNRHTGGSGLGLSIVQDIVKFHQGEIQIVNQDNYNQFIVRLPIK